MDEPVNWTSNPCPGWALCSLDQAGLWAEWKIKMSLHLLSLRLVRRPHAKSRTPLRRMSKAPSQVWHASLIGKSQFTSRLQSCIQITSYIFKSSTSISHLAILLGFRKARYCGFYCMALKGKRASPLSATETSWETKSNPNLRLAVNQCFSWF